PPAPLSSGSRDRRAPGRRLRPALLPGQRAAPHRPRRCRTTTRQHGFRSVCHALLRFSTAARTHTSTVSSTSPEADRGLRTVAVQPRQWHLAGLSRRSRDLLRLQDAPSSATRVCGDEVRTTDHGPAPGTTRVHACSAALSVATGYAVIGLGTGRGVGSPGSPPGRHGATV